LRAAVVAAEVLVGGLAPGVVAVEVGSPEPGVPVAGPVVVGTVDVGTVEAGVVVVGVVAVPVVVVAVVVPLVEVVVVGVVVPVSSPPPVAVDAEVVPAVNPPRGPRAVAAPGARCSVWPDCSPVRAVVDVPAAAAVDCGDGLCVAACAVVAAAATLELGAEDDGVAMLVWAIRAAA
jgi:hypothetical protein